MTIEHEKDRHTSRHKIGVNDCLSHVSARRRHRSYLSRSHCRRPSPTKDSDAVARVNAVFSTLTYQPIVFLYTQAVTFSQYLALLTVADTAGGYGAQDTRLG